MNKTKKAIAFLIISLCLVTIVAEVTPSTNLNFVAATTKEMKVALIQSFKIPMLYGDNPLISGNNLNIKTAFELSPVSINGKLDLNLTPVAFLVFNAGAGIASAWNLPIANGLRKNIETTTQTGELNLHGDAFDGFVWYGKAGGTFQFDFAAIFPGDWNHVVLQTTHEVKYRSLSTASPTDSWLFESDSGENRNGWNYYGSYVIGYQMPIFLQMAAILIEQDIYLYDTPGRTYWGDNLGRWIFGPVLNFQINKNLSLALVAQGRTMRNFKEGTGKYDFYQLREIDSSNPLRIEFYRVAINGTFVIK